MKKLSAADYGSSVCGSGFASDTWRMYMTGHWGHPTIRPAIPDGLRHGVLYSLTAWNPQGQTLPKADNERRNSATRRDAE